jgi:hypothetical protein
MLENLDLDGVHFRRTTLLERYAAATAVAPPTALLHYSVRAASTMFSTFARSTGMLREG